MKRRVLATLGIICLHYLIYIEVGYLASLGEQGYRSPVLIFEALTHDRVWALLGLFLAGLVYGWNRLSWERLDPTGYTRWVVMAAAAIQVWLGSTYQMNYFFGQEHLLDRFALIGLLVLLWRHPVFIYPLLFLLNIVYLQFQYPNFQQAMFMVNKRLSYDALVLFCAYLPVRGAVRLPARYYVYLSLCLVGTIYGVAGLAKIMDGPSLNYWLFNNNLHNLFVSSHILGFLHDLPAPTVISISDQLRPFDTFGQAATLVIECSGFVLLLHRRLAIVILVGCIFLHLTILATSGIMFTFWMLFDLALIIALVKAPEHYTRPMFGGRAFALSLAIMLVGTLWLSPMRFFWMDTNTTNVFWFYGKGASGQVYGLEKNHFSLYGGHMNQGRFYFLAREPVLVDTFGGSRSAVVFEELKETTPETYPEVRERLGRQLFDPQASGEFARFMRTWTQNEARHKPSLLLRILSALGPPHHNQVTPPPNPYRGQEPLVEIEAHFLEFLRDDSGLHLVDTTIIKL